eukprot:518129_1
MKSGKKIQFDVFLPIEISFLRSLNNNAIYDYYGRLVKCNIWNDDEVPLVLFSKCKQLCEKQMKGVSDGVIKSLVTTRSLKHRFLTFAPFLNGDGYTLLPDEYAICLVIFPGIIDNNDIQYFKNKCPNLRVFSNKKSWMTQFIWQEWSQFKLAVVKRARNFLRQSFDTPHFNYVDNQPNHCSEETFDRILPDLEKDYLYTRYYPKNTTLYSQATDVGNIGACIQRKSQKLLRRLCEQQNEDMMRGIPVKKIGLRLLRRKAGLILQNAFMEFVRDHKECHIKSFGHSGVNYYPFRVWGGHEKMELECKQSVINACNVDFIEPENAKIGNVLFCDKNIEEKEEKENEEKENKKKNKSKKRKQQSNTINNYFKKQRLE